MTTDSMQSDLMQSATESKPLLTIAIPTYNRARYLRELLSVLFDQLVTEPRVELIISDNASPDETPKLVAEYQQRGLQIRSIRNEVNVGPDANFLQCFEQARGKYVWIFGDDDILPTGALLVVLELLDAHEPDFLYATPKEFRDEAPLKFYQKDPRGRSPLVTGDRNRFAWKVGNMFTMVTCNVVNKQRFQSLNNIPSSELLGTGLMQLGWSLPLLANFRKGIYVYDVLVSIRAGTRSGYSVTKVFGQNFKRITEDLLGTDSTLTKILQTDVLRYCLTFLILEVRSLRFGDFDKEDYHAELRSLYGGRLDYWLFLFPVAKAPVWVAKRWLSLIRAFRMSQNLLDRKVSEWSRGRLSIRCVA